MKNITTLIAALAVTAMVSSTAHAQRGRDGHLNILYWQAASSMNPYLSGGTKEHRGGKSLVLEPLVRYDENRQPWFRWLVEDHPDQSSNGGVAADLTSASPGSSARPDRQMVRRQRRSHRAGREVFTW